jgi:DNA-binding IclR family transcriptional regulator
MAGTRKTAATPARSRKRPAEVEERPFDTAQLGDRMRLDRAGSGRAMVVPAAARRLKGHAAELVAELQMSALLAQELRQHIDELVPAARANGVSWNMIGWCLGISGVAAMKRYGADL